MTAAIKAYLWAVVATVVIAAMLFGLGTLIFQAGRTKERVVWEVREREAAVTFAKKLQAEVKRGQQASAALNRSLLALNQRYSLLEGAYRELSDRVPLVLPVAAPAVRAHGHAAPSTNGGGGANAGAQAPGQVQPGDGADRRLSLGAVWMWNSSLAGTDVPAGACGLADTSSQACSPDSGLTVEDAWANHHLNAKSCAIDRERHRALIEFITERPAE